MIPTIEPTPLEPRSFTITPRKDRRASLSPDLRESFLATGAAGAQLDRLFQAGAMCVTTGQQPGLLTGPTLTIHKAMSAVALARQCEAKLQCPVIPVFWVAGDDHDFAESNHLHLLSPNHSVERIELRSRASDAPATPLYREPVGPEIQRVFEEVRLHTPDTEFRTPLLERFSKHYQPDTDLASAFGGILAELLGELGLVVFLPTTARAKQLAAPWLMVALEKAGEIDAALAQHTAALATRGFDTPVTLRSGETVVMIEGALGRDRLIMADDGYQTRRSKEIMTPDELMSVVAKAPTRLSPNVLLRPVIEAALLPTVAYVAGSTEASYIAQASPLYEIMGVTPQAVLTRWSGRVIENRVQKTLERFGLSADDLNSPNGQVESRIASQEIPEDARVALEELRKAVGSRFPLLLAAANDIDPTLIKPIQAAEQTMLNQVGNVEKRLVAHLKKRDETAIRQVAAARNALFPNHQPQERVLNPIHYLVRYGEDYLTGLRAACETWANGLESTTGAS
jgi:bacillithiol synthase